MFPICMIPFFRLFEKCATGEKHKDFLIDPSKIIMKLLFPENGKIVR